MRRALAANPSFELVHVLPSWARYGGGGGGEGAPRAAAMGECKPYVRRRRGQLVEGLTPAQAACLVRCDPAEDETAGFFVAVFERRVGGLGAAAAGEREGGADGATPAAAAVVVDAGVDAAPALSRSKRRRLHARERKAALSSAAEGGGGDGE